MAKQRKKLPKSTSADALHTLTKAGLSAIPVVGGPVAELFANVIVPSLTRRREAWLQSLAEGLEALERKVEGLSMELLANNEAFVTIVMEASNIAIRNHTKEKTEALRNVVLNSAVKSPDEYLQGILIQFIAIATPWHFRILSFYGDPENFAKLSRLELKAGDFLGRLVVHIFPELKGKDAFRLLIERDLLQYGLIFSEGETYSRRTTETGDKVLKLIASPF